MPDEVVTEGDTKPEVLANAKEAIRAILQYRLFSARRVSCWPLQYQL